MGELVKVALADDLPPGTAKIVEVAGEHIAVFNVKGKFYGLSNTCLHKGGPIGEGKVDDSGLTVECPWHGWTYHLDTGEKVDDPSKKLKTYAVKVKGSDIFLDL